jgi:hypothetical protein
MVVITVAAVQAALLPVTGLPVFGQSATLDVAPAAGIDAAAVQG